LTVCRLWQNDDVNMQSSFAELRGWCQKKKAKKRKPNRGFSARMNACINDRMNGLLASWQQTLTACRMSWLGNRFLWSLNMGSG